MPRFKNIFCRRMFLVLLAGLGLLTLYASAFALDGAINIHDPSTVITCKGQYYVFGTGNGIPILSSPDGFTWQRAGKVFDKVPDTVHALSPHNNGTSVWAPDIIQFNGQYHLYYAISAWNDYVSAIGLVTSLTLDPKSPDYKWTDCGPIVNSVAGENLNAIDPGVTMAPDGTIWICYGSYHGNIQLVELNPQTGLRIAPDSPIYIIASRSEASDIIFHDGYFYLFVNHGSCCQGRNSTYNIRVGRSQKITGPYLDRHGEDLAQGAGTLFLAAAGKQIGPGHFGLLKDDGVEKFSCHYEAVLGRAGRSVLDIRPLLWTVDGWPLPGNNVQDGTYQIMSKQTGTIVQAAAVPMGGAAMGAPGTRAASRPATRPRNGPGQFVEVPMALPVEGARVQLGLYLVHDNQQWTITAAGNGFYKIAAVAGGKALSVMGPPTTDSAMTMPARSSSSALCVTTFANADNQLWKIDQLSDGSYRIKCRGNNLALSANGKGRMADALTLEESTGGDAQSWILAVP